MNESQYVSVDRLSDKIRMASIYILNKTIPPPIFGTIAGCLFTVRHECKGEDMTFLMDTPQIVSCETEVCKESTHLWHPT